MSLFSLLGDFVIVLAVTMTNGIVILRIVFLFIVHWAIDDVASSCCKISRWRAVWLRGKNICKELRLIAANALVERRVPVQTNVYYNE